MLLQQQRHQPVRRGGSAQLRQRAAAAAPPRALRRRPLGGRRLAAAAGSSAASGGGEQPAIRIIATDVDGTLLNSEQQLTPGVRAAVLAAADAGVPLIVATGKAPGPWVKEVIPQLSLQLPRVFLQGLLIIDGDGNVLLSRCLQPDVVRSCIQLAAELQVTLVAYCTDRIFCAATDEHTDRLLFYKEPTPEGVGNLEAHLLGSSSGSSGSSSSGGNGSNGSGSSGSSSAQAPLDIHKLIFMAPQPRIDAIRPGIEAALEGRASTTSAISGMLEVLPLGASKGAGVGWLLERLGYDPAGMLALGDGENDVEMLQMAAVGVAMGNAGAMAKAVADAVAPPNDEDGVAEAIRRYVLAPRGLARDCEREAVATAAAGGEAR